MSVPGACATSNFKPMPLAPLVADMALMYKPLPVAPALFVPPKFHSETVYRRIISPLVSARGKTSVRKICPGGFVATVPPLLGRLGLGPL